jgi:uncharacterized protein (DUF362 family)
MSSRFRRKISRRDVLGLGATLVAGSALGLTASGIVRRLRQPEQAVAILQAKSYDQDLVRLLQEGIRLYPEFSRSIRGRQVVLKPNLVEYHAGRPIITDPRLVSAAVEAFRSLQAGQVVVAEGSGHRRDTELILEASGLARELRSVRADFIDLNLDPISPVRLRNNLTGLGRLWLPKTILDADIVVSMPKLKTHHWVGATVSMKNMFGVVPGEKYGWPKNVLHWRGIENSIIDIVQAVRPAFAIVDGIEAMEGDGPLFGMGVKSGVLVFGTSLSAVDSTSARVMGIHPGHLKYLAMMIDQGGTVAESRITQLGEPIRQVRRNFYLIKEFEYLQRPLPLLDFGAGV